MTKYGKKIFSILMIFAMMISVVAVQPNETYAAGSKTKITGAKYPTSINEGKKYTVKGKIVSNKKIKRVEIGIVKASTGKWTKYKYDNRKVNAKTFNVKKAAKKLKFNKLPAGNYYYRIYAHTQSGVKTVLNKKFTVVAKVKKKVAVMTLTDNGDAVTLLGYNCPKKFDVGTPYNVRGTIKCKNTIRRVEIGIVVNATNKWCEYKYDDKSVNANAYDISKAAPALKFEKLPGGYFNYRIYVHTDNGVTIVMDEPFTVNPSNKPKQAIKWATKIANDDTYTYGKGYGGYFTCCVCADKTTKKKDAQFTCMPFLAAAFAHGTKHPALMNNGRHVMNLHDGNFKGGLGDAWFKLGLCKDLTIKDLQPGDVIIKWSATNDSGHAWMYGGGDLVIEATPAKKNADDISVKNGAAERLYRYGHSSGQTSKNYVMRFRG